MKKENIKLLIASIGGILFGFGLAIGNMTKPEVVLSFLQLHDLGLLLVMAFAILIVMPVYLIATKKLKKPLLGDKFDCEVKPLSKKTIIGAVIFGIGWGFSGLCPGSAIASIGTGNYPVIIGIIFIFIGAYIQGRFIKEN